MCAGGTGSCGLDCRPSQPVPPKVEGRSWGAENRVSLAMGNHCISKQMVVTAKGTGRAIRMEELNGIRTRAKVRPGERGVLHSWGFSQLRQMIAYKAARGRSPGGVGRSAPHQPDVLEVWPL
jgi:IS605 OrfB family transposase